MQLVAVDYVLIVVYLALMVFIGLFFGWFIKDVGAYLKGSNAIPWPVAGIVINLRVNKNPAVY